MKMKKQITKLSRHQKLKYKKKNENIYIMYYVPGNDLL